jgi:hypothetical protein
MGLIGLPPPNPPLILKADALDLFEGNQAAMGRYFGIGRRGASMIGEYLPRVHAWCLVASYPAAWALDRSSSTPTLKKRPASKKAAKQVKSRVRA